LTAPEPDVIQLAGLLKVFSGSAALKPMKFFVYSDSLNPTQLKRRAPEHQFVCKAYLEDHAIQFCRWSSQWRCGLGSVVPSPGERVWGVVVEITEEDLKLLDEFEGEVPEGAFRHLPVTVVTEEGEKMLVTAHAATPIGKFKPKEHYLEWVLKGVRHWKLPGECVEKWRSFMPR